MRWSSTLRPMEPDIRPAPAPEERAAILAALEHLVHDGVPAAYRSGWREAGIRENLEEAPDGRPGGPLSRETDATAQPVFVKPS